MDKYCIIGGDRRQIYLGDMLTESGAFVTYYALEKCEEAFQDYSSLDIAVSKCGSVILPMPLTKDGKTVNTPLSDVTVELDARFGKLLCGKRIFTSNSEKLIELTGISSECVFDYSINESLCIANAVLTAEGAVAKAVTESHGSVYNSRCLVSGYGRIGKVLAEYLAALGADVTVSARKESDLAWITALGYTAVNVTDIKGSGSFDLVFNTVPHRIFTREILNDICKKDCVYIELASPPFGADAEDLAKLSVIHIPAPGLPGKLSPKAAAEIIYKTLTSFDR